jgi:AcrR family transcriptional regulator
MVSQAADSLQALFEREPAPAGRMLRAGHELLFTHGYQAFTMDQLAHELGVSKKTLYVHFASKEAIVDRIIDLLGTATRTAMEAVVADRDLSFTQKISGVVAVAGNTLGKVSPSTLRELQRFAPAIYQKIEDIRGKVIPVVFGRLIRSGIASGLVRADVDPAFATEFWLQAIRGLVQPATLERTGLTLPQSLEKALHLFFAGLLTPAGRKDYEKRT